MIHHVLAMGTFQCHITTLFFCTVVAHVLYYFL
jgi:hypothetical protein